MTTSANPTQYMVTKNTKFEAKLARYLISDPDDQLLGYDACIEKQGTSIDYRLIVLGLESIYLTDNPPKIAQLKEPYIYYRDILRAEVIDDYPDFLFGAEKTNTLHMRLRVLMSSNKNKKRKKKKAKSPSVDDMETVPSLFDRITLENINNYMEPTTPRRSASNRDLYQAPLSQLYAAIPLLLSSPPSTTIASTTINETDPLHLPLYQLDDFSSTTVSNASNEFRERLDQLNLNTDRSHFRRLFSTRRTMSDEQRSTARSKSARSTKKKATSDSDWTDDIPRLNRYVLHKHEDSNYGTLYTPRSTPRQNHDDDMLLSTARSTLTDISLTSTTTLNSNNHSDSTVYCPSIEEVRSLQDDLDEDMKDIDIYFLSLNTKIPEILSAALCNYIVVATARYNKNQVPSTLSTLPTTDRLQHSMDVTMYQFSELKNEILQSLANTNQLIKLTEELYNSCEKYSKVKELFWKDVDLFIFYVAKFHSCTQAISNNEYDDSTINLSFAIMQLLNQVLLNTFASNERLTRLTHDQCSRFKLLVECLLTPPINLLSNQTSYDDSTSNITLKNTYRTVLQWMFISGSLLWQIGDMLSRPAWTSTSFRFQNFIELFEKQTQKDEYFDLFIDALSRLTMNNENRDPLSPKHALYVYQLFSVLSMLLINSLKFSEYISNRYLEDFKYFLKEDVILSRIPVQYPVYRFMPDLIRSVHYRILYGEPTTNLSIRTKHRQLI